MRTSEVPFGSVVVGIDAARSSATALDWAADRAALDHRALVLMHGAGHPTLRDLPGTRVGPSDPFGVYVDPNSAGRAILHRATIRAVLRQPGLEVHHVVLRADPARGLVELSDRAELVVVGSRGRGHLLSLALGSVGEDVARSAACPLVVVRPRHQAHPRHAVLVGADGGPDSARVLRAAFHEASLRGLPLKVVHTLWGSVTSAASGHSGAAPDRAAVRRSLATAVGRVATWYPDVPVVLHVGQGLPPELLLSVTGDQDLVVVGHHQRHGFDRLSHASVALAVLERATVPVVIVPLRPTGGPAPDPASAAGARRTRTTPRPHLEEKKGTP